MKDTIPKLFQAYPYLIYAFYGQALYHNDLNALYFAVSMTIILFSNPLLKMASKPFYGRHRSIPVLGKRQRPSGAKGCDVFTYCPSKSSSSQVGMPSGHSQIAWAVCMYVLLEIWYEKDYADDKEKAYYVILSVVLILLSGAVSYSRVIMECHTIQQIIVGGLFGIVLGLSAFFIKGVIGIKKDDKIV